jgi:hypothetical protein
LVSIPSNLAVISAGVLNYKSIAKLCETAQGRIRLAKTGYCMYHLYPIVFKTLQRLACSIGFTKNAGNCKMQGQPAASEKRPRQQQALDKPYQLPGDRHSNRENGRMVPFIPNTNCSDRFF